MQGHKNILTFLNETHPHLLNLICKAADINVLDVICRYLSVDRTRDMHFIEEQIGGVEMFNS